MAKFQPIGDTPFTEIKQLGMVVRDIDKTVEYYTSLGIGPFKPLAMNITEKWVRGKRVELKGRALVVKLGPVELELIQPLEGPSIFFEFLKKRGEGLHHLGFPVENLDGEEERLVKQGLKVLQKGRGPNCGYTHFETDAIGGVVLEILKTLPE